MALHPMPYFAIWYPGPVLRSGLWPTRRPPDPFHPPAAEGARFGIAFKARNSHPPSLPWLPPLSASNAVQRFEFLQAFLTFPSLLSLCPSLSFSSSPMHPRHVHEPRYSTPPPSSLTIRGSRGVPHSRSLAPDPSASDDLWQYSRHGQVESPERTATRESPAPSVSVRCGEATPRHEQATAGGRRPLLSRVKLRSLAGPAGPCPYGASQHSRRGRD